MWIPLSNYLVIYTKYFVLPPQQWLNLIINRWIGDKWMWFLMWTLCGSRCILDGTMIESVMHITRSDFDCIEPLLSRQPNYILRSGFSHPRIISSPTMLHFSLYCKLSPCLKRLQVHSRIKITHVHFKRTWAEPNFGIILVDIMDYYNLHLTSRVASYQCFNENVGSFNWGKCSQMQMHAFERERERDFPTSLDYINAMLRSVFTVISMPKRLQVHSRIKI